MDKSTTHLPRESLGDSYNSVINETFPPARLLIYLSLVLLLISNLTNGLRLHQFLVTKSAEANKSVKTDANGAH